MKTHIKSFTYKPKIERIRSGEIRQSIRAGWKVEEGDKILWHGWSGKPYRSKWSWRMRVTVRMAIRLFVNKEGFETVYHDGEPCEFFPWDCEMANRVAELDGIVPPTGKELSRVLGDMHDLPDRDGDRHRFQIIRW